MSLNRWCLLINRNFKFDRFLTYLSHSESQLIFQNNKNNNICSIKKFSTFKSFKSSKDNLSPFSFQSLSDPNKSKTNNNDNILSSPITPDIKLKYEQAAEETLQSLSEKFDGLAEELSESDTKQYDVEYSSGVLNVKLGSEKGTYVLNKQSPNLQIWLSSPISGPKRFDFIKNTWVYKRTNETLHGLLSDEISETFGKTIDFSTCAFGKETYNDQK